MNIRRQTNGQSRRHALLVKVSENRDHLVGLGWIEMFVGRSNEGSEDAYGGNGTHRANAINCFDAPFGRFQSCDDLTVGDPWLTQ